MLDVKPQSVRQLIDHELQVKHLSGHEILDRFRNSLVVRALRLNSGKMRPTAEMLGIAPEILKRWMKEAGIDRHFD